MFLSSSNCQFSMAMIYMLCCKWVFLGGKKKKSLSTLALRSSNVLKLGYWTLWWEAPKSYFCYLIWISLPASSLKCFSCPLCTRWQVEPTPSCPWGLFSAKKYEFPSLFPLTHCYRNCPNRVLLDDGWRWFRNFRKSENVENSKGW